MAGQFKSGPESATPSDSVLAVRRSDGKRVFLSPYKGCVSCAAAAVQDRKRMLARVSAELAAERKQGPTQKLDTPAELAAKLRAVAAQPVSDSDRLAFNLKMAIQDALDGPQYYSEDGERVYSAIKKPVCTCKRDQG